MIKIPINVATSPITTLKDTYAEACKTCPSRSILAVSFVKAENVVKPPRSPVARNSRHSCVMLPLSLNPNTSPMKKQPIILTVNVPNG